MGAYALKQIHLTPIKVNFPFNACTRVVRKELESNKVDDKWTQSSWAKRLENKAKRTSMNDLTDSSCVRPRARETRSSVWRSTERRRPSERLESCKKKPGSLETLIWSKLGVSVGTP